MTDPFEIVHEGCYLGFRFGFQISFTPTGNLLVVEGVGRLDGGRSDRFERRCGMDSGVPRRFRTGAGGFEGMRIPPGVSHRRGVADAAIPPGVARPGMNTKSLWRTMPEALRHPIVRPDLPQVFYPNLTPA
jgi:hypothetical protein